MNKIIVYEHPDFKGLSKEFASDVSDLSKVSFDNCISSLKVIGNPWVAYTDANFAGEPTAYEEGEYASVYYNDDISSLELVREDLNNPQITLYEDENYQGRRLVLNTETNLLYGTFNDTVSSHKVQKGAWVLYQHSDRGGYIQVARAGRDVPKYEWFDNRLTHVHPLKAGKATIKAEVEWDKKKERAKSVIIESITVVNNGSEYQIFTTDVNREYSGSVTESFKFSDSTQIGFGTKLEVPLFGFNIGQSFNASNTFTVEKGKSTTTTKTKSIRVSLPARIPPHTKLTVNVVRKEVIVMVPVKLTSTTGFLSEVEYGEYVCECGDSINTEFKEEKIQPHTG